MNVYLLNYGLLFFKDLCADEDVGECQTCDDDSGIETYLPVPYGTACTDGLCNHSGFCGNKLLKNVLFVHMFYSRFPLNNKKKQLFFKELVKDNPPWITAS